MTKDLNKGKYEAEQILTATIKAHDITTKQGITTPSVAGPAGSSERFAQKWMVRVLNSMDIAQEVTVNQVALALLGQHIEMSTGGFLLLAFGKPSAGFVGIGCASLLFWNHLKAWKKMTITTRRI